MRLGDHIFWQYSLISTTETDREREGGGRERETSRSTYVSLKGMLSSQHMSPFANALLRRPSRSRNMFLFSTVG